MKSLTCLFLTLCLTSLTLCFSQIDLIATGLGENGDVSLYVGASNAMCNVDNLLDERNITSILNCAADLDYSPYEIYCDGHLMDREYFKVGLIDDYGNEISTLASAVYALDQLIAKRPPPFYGFQFGNVLANCHAGQSRSVTVTAMYLCQKYPGHPLYGTWEKALAYVKEKRHVTTPNPPHKALLALAETLLTHIRGTYGKNATLFSIIPNTRV